ncbi:MAG: hypothetical protein HC850_12435, partial [Rhodomicrobium sp.]|nr:hypothetical protein [Rhodomicrobium sp.]
MDPLNLAIVIAGAFAAGVTIGFAGFGMGLVSAGFWFHALPAAMVPPLNAITAFPAQMLALMTIRKAFDWKRAAPFLIGGVMGVPVGVAALTAAVLLLWPELALAADAPFQEYQQRGWFWMFVGAFGFGFLTSLTPCVYPMIPIVLGIFGARGADVSRGRAMTLATLYVAGMGVTYALLGTIFAQIGKEFGSLLGDPVVVVPIVALYVALAASMFGAFELNLPSSVQEQLNKVGGRGFLGAFTMGLVGGFTAAPSHRAVFGRNPRLRRAEPQHGAAPASCSRTRWAWACCSGCSPRSPSRCPRAVAGWSGSSRSAASRCWWPRCTSCARSCRSCAPSAAPSCGSSPARS